MGALEKKNKGERSRENKIIISVIQRREADMKMTKREHDEWIHLGLPVEDGERGRGNVAGRPDPHSLPRAERREKGVVKWRRCW